MTQMNMIFLGETRPVDAEDLPPERSPHTGRDLRHVRLHIRVTGERIHDAFCEELRRYRDGKDTLRDDADGRWAITYDSYSYEDENPSYVHKIEIQETETLEASRIEFGGLSLAPERYFEELLDGQISISAIVPADAETHQSLEDLLMSAVEGDVMYFPVKRVGISDEPIAMRFGRCLWQDKGDGYRHRIRLAAEQGDTDEPGPFDNLHQPEFLRTLEFTAANSDAILALVDELHAVGVLSDEASQRVRAQADPRRRRSARRFDQSEDLERYFPY